MSLQNRPVSNPVISVSTNCYQLPTKFLHLSDNGLEIRSVFLYIFKAFDKDKHKGLIFKLKQNAISGENLHILSDFLSNRKQSDELKCHAGVSHGSILGPLIM